MTEYLVHSQQVPNIKWDATTNKWVMGLPHTGYSITDEKGKYLASVKMPHNLGESLLGDCAWQTGSDTYVYRRKPLSLTGYTAVRSGCGKYFTLKPL